MELVLLSYFKKWKNKECFWIKYSPIIHKPGISQKITKNPVEPTKINTQPTLRFSIPQLPHVIREKAFGRISSP